MATGAACLPAVQAGPSAVELLCAALRTCPAGNQGGGLLACKKAAAVVLGRGQ